MRGKFSPLQSSHNPSSSFNEARALCAGSCLRLRQHHPAQAVASMRPAHCAREVDGPALRRGAADAASMRPAHCAREVGADLAGQPDRRQASMRPAHCAREVAGGIRGQAVDPTASMRPAHCAREVVRGGRLRGGHRVASMRPAHCAREVAPRQGAAPTGRLGFNEARALCAGSSVQSTTAGAAPAALQ